MPDSVTWDSFQDDLDSATGVLVGMLERAGSVRPTKEYGCERCVACLVHLASLVHRYLKNPKAPTSAIAVVNLMRFAAFPHALLRLIIAVAEAAASDKPTRDVLAGSLTQLCTMAREAAKQDDYLGYARIAEVLDRARDKLQAAYRGDPTWPELQNTIDLVITFHTTLAIADTYFIEDRRWGPGFIFRKARAAKRICGGGVMNVAPKGSTNPQKAVVVDFSLNHVLAVSAEPFPVEGTYANLEGVYLPCQRELPFAVRLHAVRRSDQSEQGVAVRADNESLLDCGRFYQLFHIESVAPEFYYRALCALRSSKARDYGDYRFVDSYDLPKPPALPELLAWPPRAPMGAVST